MLHIHKDFKSIALMKKPPFIFRPIKFRGLELPNRIMISPMCTYQASTDGKAVDMHFAHYAQFSLGGAGLVMLEATAVQEKGRISAWDLGLWSDEQIPPLKRIIDFTHRQSTKVGIQLAHAGLKASTKTPWNGSGYLDERDEKNGAAAWQVVGPNSSHELKIDDGSVSKALTVTEIKEIVNDWGRAAARADEAGFDVIEIHGAHGYLISEFLSPLSNLRNDEYGGDFTGRTRLAREVADVVRKNWPDDKPLFFRLSVIDGVDVGWSIEDSVKLAKQLEAIGVDLIDCSSGGFKVERDRALPRTLGFQVHLASAIKTRAKIAVAAVGLITQATQAENILQSGEADLIAIGRTALNNPYWPRHVAEFFDYDEKFEQWPEQYGWWLFRWATSLKKLKGAWPLSNLFNR